MDDERDGASLEFVGVFHWHERISFFQSPCLYYSRGDSVTVAHQKPKTRPLTGLLTRTGRTPKKEKPVNARSRDRTVTGHPRTARKAKTGHESTLANALRPVTTAVKKRPKTAIGIAAGICVIAIGAVTIGVTANQNAGPALSVAPTAQPVNQPLSQAYSTVAWTLPADKAKAATVTRAGIVYTQADKTATLVDTASGTTLATGNIRGKVTRVDDIAVAGVPAVGLRTAGGYTILVPNRPAQAWLLDDKDLVNVNGSSPVIVRPDRTTAVMVYGTKDAVNITASAPVTGVDGPTVYLTDGQSPIVTTAKLTGGKGTLDDKQTVTLATPKSGGQFDHLVATGRGKAIATWTTPDGDITTVHDLTAAGEVTTTVSTPDGNPAWTVGHGADLGLYGPYAVDLQSGLLAAQAPSSQPFTAAYGSAATYGKDKNLHIVADLQDHPETANVVGYSSSGTYLATRETNGALTIRTEPSNG